MEISKRYDDVPAGENISYEHFLFYMDQGREIEFVYGEIEYFISHSSEGRAVWIGENRISAYYNDLGKEIIEVVKIDGVSLAALIKQKKIKITTIF